MLDENLNPRLAAELRKRGREARSVQELRLKGKPDREILEEIHRTLSDPVLITLDDRMPLEQASMIKSLPATVVHCGSLGATHGGRHLPR